MTTEILMFTGPNCSACTAMKPIAEMLPNLKMVDITSDEANKPDLQAGNMSLLQRYGIRGGIPVFVKLIDGVYEERTSGSMPQSVFNKWVAG